MTDSEPTTPPPTSPTVNPLGQRLQFKLRMPAVEVRMVNAAALSDYEIWIFVASLASSAGVGFLVAYVQSGGSDGRHLNTTLLVIAVIFVILAVVAIVRALILRKTMTRDAKTYRMTASEELTSSRSTD